MLTKSIIWDIDGTVIDTRNAMASAIKNACHARLLGRRKEWVRVMRIPPL